MIPLGVSGNGTRGRAQSVGEREPRVSTMHGTPSTKECRMLNDFRRHLLSAGRRTKTIELRLYWMRRIMAEYGDLTLVSAEMLEEFLAREWKPETRKSIRSTLRVFYGWAVKARKVLVNPAADLPPVRVPSSIPKVAVDADVAKALRCALPEVAAMVALGRFACLRLYEITTLRTDHRHGDFIRFEGKGGKWRVVHLHPEVARALDELERINGPGYYFKGRYGGHRHETTVHNWIKAATGWNPHALRHAGASASYRRTTDVRAIQEMLGHSSMATTQKYLHLGEDAQRRAAMATSLDLAS